jgi:phage terminase large subunit
MTSLQIELPEKLGVLFSGEADYRGAYGGRGGAKTIGFAKMAVAEMLSLYEGRPWNFLCGRELQKSLKDSVFSVIASQIIEMGLSDQFDVGREFIRHKNGNEFLFYGLRTNISEI